MSINDLKTLWKRSTEDILKSSLSEDNYDVLAKQTYDSIRRISIYKLYREKAIEAERSNLSYFHTSNPFTLSQRDSLSNQEKVWIIYLATYFGKSHKSKWKMFNKSAFKTDNSLFTVSEIQSDKSAYLNHLEGIDLFHNANYSNHRKYSKKSLYGRKGFIFSLEFFLENINNYTNAKQVRFDDQYINALKIPNFGRMAAFDYTSSLCKCNLNVDDPLSMYHQYSTGPLSALKDILVLADVKNINKRAQIDLGDKLLEWFLTNSRIPMMAQVLEDAICNWQKSPTKYKKYFG